MDLKAHSKYFLFAFFILLLVGAFFIVKPFVGAILTSLVLGYIFYPVFHKLNSKLKRPYVSALLITLLLLIIILVPLFFFSNLLIKEATHWYQNSEVTDVTFFIENNFNIELSENAKNSIANFVEDASTYTFKLLSDFLISLPQRIINFIIMMFIFFFVFIEGEKFSKWFRKAFPIQESHKTQVFHKLENTINSLVYGEIVISILEGVVAVFGFWLLGVSSPVLWGLVVAIVALLPAIGPLVVWVPLAIVSFLQGDIVQGIGLVVFGGLILTIILDMIVKPKVLGYKGHIHPVIILLGVLGGISVFGLTGIILGPVILVLLVLLVEIYVKEGIK